MELIAQVDDNIFNYYCIKNLSHNWYLDINECLMDNGGCEHSCTNLEGINNATGLGYQCGCQYGYQLAPNNDDCNGI